MHEAPIPLRDYTYYVPTTTGFSGEVDAMLIQAAKVDTRPEHKKNVILLWDEMHIWEDIVFDKHSGAMIGFTKLGDINDNLLKFERSVTEDQPSSCQEYDGFYGARPVQQTPIPLCTVSVC